MADKIEIGPEGDPKVVFGVDTAHRPNPFTSPGRDYSYDGAGKLITIRDRVSLTCIFIYEPSEIWDKFAEIKTELEHGTMDFRYYRDSIIVLNLKTSEHVGSPRYENITPSGTPGELANHVKFTMDVISEKGSFWGNWILDVDRTVEVESSAEEEGGNVERRTITVRGEMTPSLAIIESFIGQADIDKLETVKYSYQPDKNVWSATSTIKQKSNTGIEAFHESISVTGGGQELSFFQRTGSRLPLKIVGKMREFIIVITGEVRGPDISKLRIPARTAAGLTPKQRGVKGKSEKTRTGKVQRLLGKSGATEFSIGIVESNPDGSPKTFSLKYTEIYKRAVEEDKIQRLIQTDYQLRTVADILAGQAVIPTVQIGFLEGANWSWGWIESAEGGGIPPW